MKKATKLLSVVLSVLMLTMLLPFAAFAGTETGTLPGGSTVSDVTIDVVVPTNLNFALDPLELSVTSGSQIETTDYFFINKTLAPVKVALELTATLANGVTLVSNPSTLKPYDTNVTTKNVYFGALGATGITPGGLTFSYVFGSGTDPVGTYDSTKADVLAPFDTTSDKASIAFALDKATDSDADDDADTLAAGNKGVAAFQFYGKMNTYAAWAANDVTVSGAYTLTALSATTYANYTTDDQYLDNGLNQILIPTLVSGITVTGAGNAITVVNGGTLQMSAAVLPAGATLGTVTWSVTNGTGAATINASGLLTGTADGTVTVTATADDGSGITGTLQVTVTAAPIAVTALTVTGAGGATTVTNGGTLQMTATPTPANATNSSVTWSVTNGTGAATINGTGLLTGTANGTVTVTATADDGSNVTGTLQVTVTAAPIALTGLTVTGTGGATTVASGGTLQMIATPTPANATNPSVTWSVTNGTGAATIDANTGVLTGGATMGTVTVTATSVADSNITATMNVTVTYSGAGFINGASATTVTAYPGAVINSSKSAAIDIQIPFYFKGLTVTSLVCDTLSYTLLGTDYSINGNNLVISKANSSTFIRATTTGVKAFTLRLSDNSTYTFSITVGN